LTQVSTPDPLGAGALELMLSEIFFCQITNLKGAELVSLAGINTPFIDPTRGGVGKVYSDATPTRRLSAWTDSPSRSSR
jgi:hypothetical protein